MKGYLVATGTVFALLALLHLWRIIGDWPRFDIWPAALGLVAAGLSLWAWRLLRLSARP